MNAPIQEFSSFAAERGYDLPAAKIEPGKRFRFSTNGRADDDAGWALMFEDGAGGVVGDWRTGEKHVWQAKRERPFTPNERREFHEKAERAKREAETREKKDNDQKAAKARAIWNEAKPATAEHPYLKAKGVRPSGKTRIYQGLDLAELGNFPATGALLIPFQNSSGELRALQFIAANGDKRFLGSPSGNYHAVVKADDAPVICIAEGYATGASVYMATEHPVRNAGSSGNLLAVARAIRDKLPDAKLILCADNDLQTVCPRHKKEGVTEALSPFQNRPDWCRCNPGLTDAIEAARTVGGNFAVPEAVDGKATDFNDLARAKGSQAVKAAVAQAIAPQATTPAPAPARSAPSGDPGKPAPANARDKTAPAPTRDKQGSETWPNPQPLPSQLPPVAPFSFDLLPAMLRPWIEDVTERIQCPPEFPAVGALVSLGSAIGRRLAVRPRAHDDWHEFPNLWGMIVGSPGVLKSPALAEAMRPLKRLEAGAAELHRATLIAWQADKEGGKIRREAARSKARQAAIKGDDFDAAALVAGDDDEEPKARRYIVNDCSIEALGEVLRFSPNGVLAYRDELSGLLKSMEREGNESARAFYLSAYSGKEAHVFDRIGRGLNLRVDHCCVSMLGSIQPSVIGQYLRETITGSGGDGLLSRFSLLVWPDVSREWRNVDRWPETAARQAVNALFDRVDVLQPETIGAEREEGEASFLRLSDSAREAFVEWRGPYEASQRKDGGEDHPALVAHFAKYRKLVPTLALVFHLADNGTGPISEAAILRALGWAEMLESHARRAYASVQQARVESARTLLVKIKRGALPNPFSLRRDVVLKGWSGLAETEDARQAVELLEELDYVRGETLPTPGRSKIVYWINPRATA